MLVYSTGHLLIIRNFSSENLKQHVSEIGCLGIPWRSSVTLGFYCRGQIDSILVRNSRFCKPHVPLLQERGDGMFENLEFFDFKHNTSRAYVLMGLLLYYHNEITSLLEHSGTTFIWGSLWYFDLSYDICFNYPWRTLNALYHLPVMISTSETSSKSAELGFLQVCFRNILPKTTHKKAAVLLCRLSSRLDKHSGCSSGKKRLPRAFPLNLKQTNTTTKIKTNQPTNEKPSTPFPWTSHANWLPGFVLPFLLYCSQFYS